MAYTKRDIDEMIIAFSRRPSQEVWTFVNKWYADNQGTFEDQEYIMCVYLFIIGANIHHKYVTFSRDQHMQYVKELKDMILDATPHQRPTRKLYLDYGTKTF